MPSVFRADLHLHTCLSPCGDLDMSPRGIIEAALERGLDIIAICDHNTAENAAACFRAAARAGGPSVLAGLEVCSSEEVHILTLFDSPETADNMQAYVYAHMPPRTNRPEIFGEQVIANEDDEVEGFNDRLLIGATNLNLAEIVTESHRLGGLALASHIDREAFSLLGQLGFTPPDLELDGFELSKNGRMEDLLRIYPDLTGRPIIRSSDAHFLPDVGSAWTEFYLERPELAELELALMGKDGRQIGRTGIRTESGELKVDF